MSLGSRENKESRGREMLCCSSKSVDHVRVSNAVKAAAFVCAWRRPASRPATHSPSFPRRRSSFLSSEDRSPHPATPPHPVASQ